MILDCRVQLLALVLGELCPRHQFVPLFQSPTQTHNYCNSLPPSHHTAHSLFLDSHGMKVRRGEGTRNFIRGAWKVKGHFHGSEELWRHELPHAGGRVGTTDPTQVHRTVPIWNTTRAHAHTQCTHTHTAHTHTHNAHAHAHTQNQSLVVDPSTCGNHQCPIQLSLRLDPITVERLVLYH